MICIIQRRVLFFTGVWNPSVLKINTIDYNFILNKEVSMFWLGVSKWMETCYKSLVRLSRIYIQR